MSEERGSGYYLQEAARFLAGFEASGLIWSEILTERYGGDASESILGRAREIFIELLPALPFIGGDENPQTGTFVGSVECLAFYRAMQTVGRTAVEAGRMLYDAVCRLPVPELPGPVRPDDPERDARMARRRAKAAWSQERRYPQDYVYKFVEGDGATFDYGYDFFECASEKFYRQQGALEFLPFYCFLDFPKCERVGLGLRRTTTLGEGGAVCDFRFLEGGRVAQMWPPAFVLPG